MFLLMLVFAVSGLLIIAFGLPLAQNKIKPNGWYGFRLPDTIKQPELWYPVNAALGKGLVLLGGLTIIISLWLGFVGILSEARYGSIMSIWLLIGVLVVFGKAYNKLRKLRKERML